MAARFTVLDAPQRSVAWYQARLGKLTGSRAAAMLATITGKKEAADRRNLRIQLALERITGRSQERTFQSRGMQYGVEQEADALAQYEAQTGFITRASGFLTLVAEPEAGCSLDGYVGDYEGIVEAKAPYPATHLEYIRTGVVPDDYLKQCVHNLWVSGAHWCDWFSFCPEFPEASRTKIVRVPRVESVMAAYELEAVQFLRGVAAEVLAIQRLST